MALDLVSPQLHRGALTRTRSDECVNNKVQLS
jgi:hypothetical protein